MALCRAFFFQKFDFFFSKSRELVCENLFQNLRDRGFVTPSLFVGNTERCVQSLASSADRVKSSSFQDSSISLFCVAFEMDDLGEVQEEYVDKYEFLEVRPQRTLDKTVKLPANHRNLLACSALHGKLYAGIGTNVRICSVSDLRDVPKKPSESTARYECSAPITTVDLSRHDVADILHVALLLADTILAVLATSASDSSKTVLLFLHVTALCHGDVMLRSAPALTGITAIAVCPYDVDIAHETSALFMCLTDDNSVYVHRISETKAEQLSKIGVLGALSLAISQRSDTSHDVLAAIGTSRGNVVLLNPLDGQQVGTIVEVESGWLPVQVHFAGAGYLFTTYHRDNNTKNVMWHLQRKSSTSVSTDGHSPLGELCYQLFFKEPEQDTSIAPSMMFSFIPEWSLAVVSSSVSTDIAIIAKSDDGVWVNYKLDDKKEAVMPVVDGEDCVPIGMAFDLNNTSPIPAPDPDDPDINPMPTLVILSNTGVLLSFRLVDDHAKATCSIVRDVGPLPALPAPIAEISPTASTKLSGEHVSPNSHPQQARPIKQSTLAPQKLFSSVPTDSKPPAAALPSSTSNIGAQSGSPSFGLSPSTTFTFPTGDPFKYPASSKPPPRVHVNVTAEDNATSFSSKFNFSTPPRVPSMFSAGRGHSSSKPPAPPSHRRPSSFIPQTSPKVFTQSPKPNPLPTQQKLPLVRLESKLDHSLNMLRDASSGDSLSAISSILHEMAEELRTTYNASRAINEQLAVLKPSISSLIEKVSKEINVRLNELARGFETEKKLRQGATECMTMVLKLHRDYETICMEDSAQREDSISNQLREKYRVAEERMFQKESEIEKGIAYITNKLEPSEFEQRARKDPAETMHMIYSCISLQGLRIKRLLTLLNSLFERAELDNQNGRRSDLGLSLARLEKLSLGQSSRTLPGKDGAGRKSLHGRHSHEPQNTGIYSKFERLKDEPSSVSNEVRDVLRRLAMRGGRANITVDTSVVTQRTMETGSSSSRRRPASTVLTGSDISSTTNVTNVVTPDYNAPSSQMSTPIQSKQRSFSTTIQTQPPPPPPPHTQREQTTPFTSRSQRQSTEPFKPDTTTPIRQESPFSLFGSQAQPPVFPDFQKTSAIPKKENPVPATTTPKKQTPISTASIPKQESPLSTTPISHSAKRYALSNQSALSTPSKGSDRPKSDSSSTHSVAEESLPTIDITSSPGSAKKHQWDNVPVTSIVRTPPVASFRPSPSAESVSSKPSPVKKSAENGDGPTIETVSKSPEVRSQKVDRKSSEGSLFAALPPDDSLTTPLQQTNVTPGTAAVPLFGNAASAPSFSISSSFVKSPSKPDTAQSTPDVPLQTAKKSNDIDTPSSTTLGLFGSQLSLGGSENEPGTEKGSAANTTSLFGVPVTNNSSHASASGGTSSFASFGSFTSPSNASGTPQSSAKTTAVSPFGALNAASSASASTTMPTSIGSSAASSANIASMSPFGMVNPASSNASAGSFGAAGSAPFGTFGGGSGFNNASSAGGQGFGGVGAGNGGNASLFQAAASKMTEPSSKGAESIGTADRMGQGDGSSSDDDSDREGSGVQRLQGMETTPSGFGESTPPTQEQRPTNLFGTPSNGGIGGGSALFGGGGSGGGGSGGGGANALFGTGGSTAFSTPPNSGALGGTGTSFGMPSSFGGGGFDGSAAFGSTSTFGVAATQQSSFGAPSPVGGNAVGFAGMTAKFGESTFGGVGQQQQQQSPTQFRTPASTTFGGANAGQSPFGAVGSGDSGASPFAAAAGGGGSAFGSFSQSAAGAGAAGGLMFGSGKPPAFTASSFYERRA